MIRPILALALTLGACAPPKTYREAVLEAGMAYAGLAHVATAYASQPRCAPGAPPPPLCADKAAVVALGRASGAVRAALDVAIALDGRAAPNAQERALASVADALSAFRTSTEIAGAK